MITSSHENMMPLMILLGVSSFNLGIAIGLLLGAMPGLLSGQMISLVLLELAVVGLAYRYGKHPSGNAKF